MAGVVDDSSDVEIEYDEDGNPIAPPRKREIDPLPPIDHDDITYKPFEKNFYVPHEDINNLTRSQLEELRSHLKIRVSGPLPPRPVVSFAHFGFDERLMKVGFVNLEIHTHRLTFFFGHLHGLIGDSEIGIHTTDTNSIASNTDGTQWP